MWNDRLYIIIFIISTALCIAALIVNFILGIQSPLVNPVIPF